MGAAHPDPSTSGRLREMRLAKDLSQARLARLAGISKRTLERIETNSDGKVTLCHLVNLALVLDCELGDLLDDAWLTYRQTDVSVPAPARASLADPAAPRRRYRGGRERARPRPKSK